MPTRIGIGTAILDVEIGDSTPGGGHDVYLMEDGTSGLLLEAGATFYLLESSA